MEMQIDERTRDLIREYVPDRATLRALADFFGALGDSTRVKILSALSISPMCVSDITEMLELNQTTVSHQLRTLRDQGMVDFHRRGKVLVYYIAQLKVLEVLSGAAEII